ncbi:lipoprotein [Nitratireductor sp. XY-223]|uniref:LPS translocon maturation chaperone LptM n=1 Tax=Nitratireductor sp. XY-223 TaxID=2561926 RepID=UPI0010A9A1DD|nr:lipoprotein [Nitratireductor sp. XY-223]
MTAKTAAKLATLAALTALAVSGCGRKGDLEIPRSEPVVENPDGTEEPERKDRRFILDPLIQ